MNSVYFSFVAAGNTAVVSINGNLLRPQVAIISPINGCSGSSFTSSNCQLAPSGNTVTVSAANLTSGNTYLIIVDGYQGNTGSFELCINSYQATGTVPNDLCSGATYLCPNNRYFSTTNGATSIDGVEPRANTNTSGEWDCNSVVDNSVWFTFTTTNPVQPINFSINSNCIDKPNDGNSSYPDGGSLQFEVFKRADGRSDCAPRTSINQNGTWSSVGCTGVGPGGPVGGSLSIPAVSLAPNTQYYVVVDNFPGCACDFDFTITGNQGAAAGLDQNLCLNAAAFSLPGFTPTSGGTWSGPGVTSAGNFNPASAGIGSHSLFYTFGSCTDVKIVNVTAPTVNVSPDVNLCAGQCATLLGNATQPQTTISNPSFSNTLLLPIFSGKT
jgi:hypothetical protein